MKVKFSKKRNRKFIWPLGTLSFAVTVLASAAVL